MDPDLSDRFDETYLNSLLLSVEIPKSRICINFRLLDRLTTPSKTNRIIKMETAIAIGNAITKTVWILESVSEESVDSVVDELLNVSLESKRDLTWLKLPQHGSFEDWQYL